MGCSPGMNPYGGPLILVDEMLGNAYEVVRRVARHLPCIKYIADNLEAIVTSVNLSLQSLAPVSGTTLTCLNQTYSPDTTVGQTTLILPPSSSVAEGNWIEVGDPLGNANVNPITVQASPGDQIFSHGAGAGQHIINTPSCITRYTLRKAQWHPMQYGVAS